MEEQEERGIQSQRVELPQVMMMISIVLFQKQTELGSIYLEEGTDLGDTRQETQYRDPGRNVTMPGGGRETLSAHASRMRENPRFS